MIIYNTCLKPYNTFGLQVKAKEFLCINTIADLKYALDLKKPFFVLGAGSNYLITKDIEELVLHINLKGIEVVYENQSQVYIKVAAGEVWHNFVMWCIDRNYGGIENLSLIPGSVGASPVQNIGAYGVEVKDAIHSVEVVEIASKKVLRLVSSQCQFQYRNSIFKTSHKGKYIITSVTYCLSKKHHQLKLDYGDIIKQLDKNGITYPNIKQVSNAVIQIRNSKLPNPNEIGNGGSFFKNPIIDKDHFEKLKMQYPYIKGFILSKSQVKVSAAWLIDSLGWKGYRNGDVGVHCKQALVLVNYKDAKGIEIFQLAKKIQKSVWDEYHILLDLEVNVY